jgi:hypothetical protein
MSPCLLYILVSCVSGALLTSGKHYLPRKCVRCVLAWAGVWACVHEHEGYLSHGVCSEIAFTTFHVISFAAAVPSSFLPGYPRLQPASLGHAAFTLRIAATGSGNCTCAVFQQKSYSLLSPTPDSITGNLTAPASDLPVPLDPAATDPTSPVVVARFPPVELVSPNVEFNMSVVLSQTNSGSGSQPLVVYCALFAGAVCNGANSPTCSAIVSTALPVLLVDGMGALTP